eukprot:gene20521-27313_t
MSVAPGRLEDFEAPLQPCLFPLSRPTDSSGQHAVSVPGSAPPAVTVASSVASLEPSLTGGVHPSLPIVFPHTTPAKTAASSVASLEPSLPGGVHSSLPIVFPHTTPAKTVTSSVASLEPILPGGGHPSRVHLSLPSGSAHSTSSKRLMATPTASPMRASQPHTSGDPSLGHSLNLSAGPRARSSMDASVKIGDPPSMETSLGAMPMVQTPQESATSIGVNLEHASTCPSAGACTYGSLDCFPVTLLEEILQHVGAKTLCQAAQVSSAFRKASFSDVLWENLFQKKWGDAIFPTEPHLMLQAVGHQSHIQYQHPNTAHHVPHAQQQQLMDLQQQQQQEGSVEAYHPLNAPSSHKQQQEGSTDVYHPLHAPSPSNRQVIEGLMDWSREGSLHGVCPVLVGEGGRCQSLPMADPISSPSLSDASLLSHQPSGLHHPAQPLLQPKGGSLHRAGPGPPSLHAPLPSHLAAGPRPLSLLASHPSQSDAGPTPLSLHAPHPHLAEAGPSNCGSHLQHEEPTTTYACPARTASHLPTNEHARHPLAGPSHTGGGLASPQPAGGPSRNAGRLSFPGQTPMDPPHPFRGSPQLSSLQARHTEVGPSRAQGQVLGPEHALHPESGPSRIGGPRSRHASHADPPSGSCPMEEASAEFLSHPSPANTATRHHTSATPSAAPSTAPSSVPGHAQLISPQARPHPPNASPKYTSLAMAPYKLCQAALLSGSASGSSQQRPRHASTIMAGPDSECPPSPTTSVMSCGFATDSECSLPVGPLSSSASLAATWQLPQGAPQGNSASLFSWQLTLPQAGPPSSRSISRASSMSGVLAPSPQPPQPTSWRSRYRHQSGYIRQMRCPRCGGGRVVPIVYGFPSPAFLEGMKSRRLILGGDHLIENCHVWACTKCNSSYRTYPYADVDVWQAELQLLSERPSGSNPGGLPNYTYEL